MIESKTDWNEENSRRRLRADVEKEWEEVPLDLKLRIVYEGSDDDFEPAKKVNKMYIISRSFRTY
jgi:hypothetical protein